MTEFVQNLIQRKKLTDAVGLICSFKLTDKFSPLPLLTEYMEDLKEYTSTSCKAEKPIEEKDKISDDEIAALTAVIECIKDYNLGSNTYLRNISSRIKLLEHGKKNRRHTTHLACPKVEQELPPPLQQQQKRRNNAVAHQVQQQEGIYKFPRTYSSSVGPRGSTNFIPFDPQLPDFPPPQFVWGGSSNILGPNRGVFPNSGARYCRRQNITKLKL